MLQENEIMESGKINRDKSDIKKPGMFWLVTEAARALLEYGTFFPYKHFTSSSSEGDGHPVLILPGFMSGDMSTRPLREFLKSLGYQTFGWGLGRNFGEESDIDRLLDLSDSIFQEHRKKITIIGWSLGGIYARQIAKSRPHLIRQVITLGSPFSGLSANNHVAWIHKAITSGRVEDVIDPELLADIPKPAPVPTTAIYSKQDGIVPWEYCIEQEESDIHQNIQVYGSHLGLGVNPTVVKIIVDRLKYSRHNWTKFSPQSGIEDMILYPA